ncbi:MAG: hypothetical protein M3N25_05615 [Actinomycetota bacterium]|nr:hypothetical protein [Actinomycetota bacterium]MDP9020263.1 hypothetical protein [Actinomycetota bacterium]
MPWCDGCSRFWTVDAVVADRTCPACGDDLPEPGAGEDLTTPWHFKLLVVAVIVYLGWRAVQGVQWLVAQL